MNANDWFSLFAVVLPGVVLALKCIDMSDDTFRTTYMRRERKRRQANRRNNRHNNRR